MSPTGKIKAKSRRYLGDTMILQTCFETADGRVSVTDFMPIRGQAPDIVRIVEGLEGSVAMHSELGLRFDYGRTHPLVRSRTACEAVGIAGSNAVKLCRSEEHTSELQSLMRISYAVFCLKNKKEKLTTTQ